MPACLWCTKLHLPSRFRRTDLRQFCSGATSASL